MRTSRGSLELIGPQALSPLTAQPAPPPHPEQRHAGDHKANGRFTAFWWQAGLPDLPLRPPRGGSMARARNVQELKALLSHLAAPDLLRAASLTWPGSNEHGSCTTQTSYTRAMSWWLWWAQSRGLLLADIPQREARVYATATYAAGLLAASCRLRIQVVTSSHSLLHACGPTARNPFIAIERSPGWRAASGQYLSAEHLHDLLTWASVHENRRTQEWLGLLIGKACSVSAARTCSFRDLTREDTHHHLHLRAPDGTQCQRVYDSGPYASSLLSAYLHERERAPGPLMAAVHGLLLGPLYTGELLRRIALQALVPLDGPASPAVSLHSLAAAPVRAGEPSAVMPALHGCAAGGDIDRALVYNAAPQRWDARLSAGSHNTTSGISDD